MPVHIESQQRGIEVWPETPRVGERVHVAFRAARIMGAMNVPRYEVTVRNARRRKVATLLLGRARATGGVVSLFWDGRDDAGAHVPPGAYQLRVQGAGSSLLLERTLLLDP